MSVRGDLELRVFPLQCGQLPVVVGAAPAGELYAVSFADILDEAMEAGYQRPFDPLHSREFRAYIDQPGATTIPLTFNLRGREGDGWRLGPCEPGGLALLTIRRPGPEAPPVLAQVDCQHRLGMMADSAVPLTFQCYLGLTPRDEMLIFSTINGKAKGLNPSLLDFHASELTPELETVHLELFVAKTLHKDPNSVWHGLVKMGGAGTQGVHRRVSLRGLQTATKLLLQRSALGATTDLTPRQKYEIVRAFWSAVATVWERAWNRPRNHLLVKGVGVTALSLLAADILTAALSHQQRLNRRTFENYLAPLAALDWSTEGMFKGYGGRQGAAQAHELLRSHLFAPSLAALQQA